MCVLFNLYLCIFLTFPYFSVIGLVGVVPAHNEQLIIIIIIIINIITVMQGTYNYVPETNHVSGVQRVRLFRIYVLQVMVFYMLIVLYFYISAFRIAVSKMVVFVGP